MATHLHRNIITFASGEGLSGLSYGMVAPMTVLAVLLHENGARPWMIGSLMAIQQGASVLPQMLGVYLFRSNRRRKVNLVLWSLTMLTPPLIAMSALVYWSPQIGPAFTRWGLICGFLLFSLAGGMPAAVWMDWLAHLFEQKIRGRVFGIVFGSLNLTQAGGAVIGGAVLLANPGNTGFAILYLASGVLLFVANTIFLAARDPAQHADEVVIKTDFTRMLSLFAYSLRSRNFRNFLIGRLLATLGLSMMPFIIIYYLSAHGGELEEARIIQFSAGQWIMASLALVAIGWIGDRWGHRLGIVLGTLMQIFALLLLVTTAGPWSCLAVYAILGICQGANSVSHYNLLCETCPHDNRKVHITAGNLAMLPSLLMVPIFAGLLVEYYSIAALQWACLIISIAAFAWFVCLLKEPRTTP